MAKNPTLEQLKDNYTNALPAHEDFLAEIDKWQRAIDADYPINTGKGRSRRRPKLIRSLFEFKYPIIEEVFLSNNKLFKINPTTSKDVEAAKQNEAILDYQWKNKVNRVKFINEAVRSFVDFGNVFIKIGWNLKHKVTTKKIKKPIYLDADSSLALINKGVEEGKITREEADKLLASGEPIKVGEEDIEIQCVEEIENSPFYEVCNPEDIIIDPTATDISDAQFVIHRFETSFGSLKSLAKQKLKDGRVIGIYDNISKLQAKLINKNDYDDDYNDDYDDVLNLETDEQKSFNFSDIARKKVQVFEYWGYWDFDGNGILEPFVATWCNDILIRLEKSPYPFDELPFVQAKYLPRFKKQYGESEAEILEDYQQSLGSMVRAMHDITSDLAVNQTFIEENFFSSPIQKKNFEEGKTVYFRAGADPRVSIFRAKPEPIPQSVMAMIQYNTNESQLFSGVKLQEGQNLSGSAVSSVQAKNTLTLSQKKELEIIRRFAEAIKEIGKRTIQMNALFLPEEYVVRITDKEFVKIDKSKLKGNFDFDIAISTPEKDSDTAQKLNILMQTNAAHMDPKLSKMIYAKIAELWRQPDLAEEIRNYNPEPNPMEQVMAQLQIQKEQLNIQLLRMQIAKIAKDIESEDSKIEERESRIAKHLLAESDEKEAKAKKLQAETVKILSEAKALEPKLELEKQKLETSLALKENELQSKFALHNEIESLKEENRQLKEQLSQLLDAITQNSNNNAKIDKPTIAEADIYKTTQKLLDDLKGDKDGFGNRV